MFIYFNHIINWLKNKFMLLYFNFLCACGKSWVKFLRWSKNKIIIKKKERLL